MRTDSIDDDTVLVSDGSHSGVCAFVQMDMHAIRFGRACSNIYLLSHRVTMVRHQRMSNLLTKPFARTFARDNDCRSHNETTANTNTTVQVGDNNNDSADDADDVVSRPAAKPATIVARPPMRQLPAPNARNATRPPQHTQISTRNVHEIVRTFARALARL